MTANQIIPHLWYDKEAKEAARFYTSLFPGSRIVHEGIIRDTPSGDCDVVSFDLAGQRFMAISAGPYFKFNPSVSFFLNFDPSKDPQAREHLDETWERLAKGGKALMPLDAYPFSPRYGWIQDKYGLSWQLILSDPKGEDRPFIVPSLLFVGDRAGSAEEAIEHYTSLFPNSHRGQTARYGPGQEHDREGTLMFADFTLSGQWFAAMDSAHPGHDFTFNEAVSFLIDCETQKDIDHYWKLSAVPEAEQCGWLKDRFGVSWQVAPADMQRMMEEGTAEQIDSVTQAFLKMKKFDLAALKRAYEHPQQVKKA